ncbi:hypothetical protein M8542_37815 [Amycolatopsis sp. OK19-0408]|uniref:YbaB/EbfC DNA-binding family protein n=1 Tax=Amycolatopsis iheyensis TaxID=2945988 RepID=A0A9X2SN64_9PSEU|nr:hypothetical protein [Amycolatopsis iheyensis]MCR6488602.1 hypothetical protein [Amycolatopsis iheyensis]
MITGTVPSRYGESRIGEGAVPDDDWAFEAEIDLWDDGEAPRQTVEDEPEPTGRGTDQIVTVTLSSGGDVLLVKLAVDWKSKIDPRALDTSVLTAANAALIDALAQRASEVRDHLLPRPTADPDETPLTAEDVLRLSDAVDVELEALSARMSEVSAGSVSAESAGGHVSGTAQNGRYLSLDLDATWASIARNAEVEGELLDVLGALRRKSAPAGSTAPPTGPAYTELMGLLADPARLLRRVGLTPPPGLSAEGHDHR